MSVFCPKRLAGYYLNVRCVEAGGRAQYREVSGGGNFGCMPFERHFGLGDIESGLRQRFESPINTSLVTA
jgi:hypothetical protein